MASFRADGQKYDVIMSSMTITAERAKTVSFSERYFRTPQRLIAAKGSPLKFTVEGMKGKRVGVQRGTTADMYLSKFWGPRGMDVVRYEDQDKAYADLVNGRLDASFQDELQVEAGFLKSEPGKAFAFVGPSINGDNAAEREVLGSGAGMAVRKEDKALLDKLNKAIAPCAPMARSEAERAVLRPRYLLITGFSRSPVTGCGHGSTAGVL
jgi:ABC-type amino acid transport substrate-binding protein